MDGEGRYDPQCRDRGLPMRVVYLNSLDYARRTGGWVYNSRLAQALAGEVARFEDCTVPVAFPAIEPETRAGLARRLATMGGGDVLLADHLHIADLGPLLTGRRFRVVSIFHHSSAIEDAANGGTIDRGPERMGLSVCDAVIVTSHETRVYLQHHYAIAAERIVVAIPGADRVPRTRPETSNDPLILSLGAVIPRKRHDYLLDVAACLPKAGWRWMMVGDLARHPGHVEQLRLQIGGLGLADRVHLAGTVSDADLEQLWEETALFVAGSLYEGYGMAVAEALRHGVPVVTTRSGAVASWAGEGVVLGPSDDAGGFAAEIAALLADPAERMSLADAAWRFGSGLPNWQETFAGIAARIDGACRNRSVRPSG